MKTGYYEYNSTTNSLQPLANGLYTQEATGRKFIFKNGFVSFIDQMLVHETIINIDYYKRELPIVNALAAHLVKITQ